MATKKRGCFCKDQAFITLSKLSQSNFQGRSRDEEIQGFPTPQRVFNKSIIGSATFKLFAPKFPIQNLALLFFRSLSLLKIISSGFLR